MVQTQYPKVQLQKLTVQGIPALTLSPEGVQAAPVVFWIPGYGGTKEGGLGMGYQLAQRGLFFISFDPLYHGERYDPRLDAPHEPNLGGEFPPETGLDMGRVFYQVIGACLPDVQTLLDHFAGDPRLDETRCGVTGLSLGGYASFSIFANLAQMKAAVPMIGLPNFTRRWTDIIDECIYSNPDWAAALAKKKDQLQANLDFIARIDPLEKLEAAAPRALFIQNCDYDYDQPKLYSIYAYRSLLPAYRDHPHRLQLRIYPAAHRVTPEMEQDAVDWFFRFLFKNSLE